MDPFTHAVIGMSIAKMTGNSISLSDPAAVAVTVGAIFPDIDILFQKWGDYVYLKNHRGITHSLLGLLASSIFIAISLKAFYYDSSIYALFFWSLLGSFSHTAFDLFNIYGAKLLWPFSERKFTLSLMTSFDPIFVGLLVIYTFGSGITERMVLTTFLLYLISRIAMRKRALKGLKSRFGCGRGEVSVLPCITGLLRWHFVLDKKDCNIVGEISVFRKKVQIIRKLYKIQDEIPDKVIDSPAGIFFSEFTPLFHIASEKIGDITKYIFTDMRYYIKNNFMYHAIVELDENNAIIKSSFNPYSINRSVDI